MNSQPKFEVVSTFAGGGGSSTGYRMAGGKVLLAVEWDENAVETYRANYPDTPVFHGDIADLGVDDCLQRIGKEPGELDILDGSPPCQGFSLAGRRKFGDTRNRLFRQYVRLLRGLRPKVFVMENVSGMVKGNMKFIFAEILRELKSCGYCVSVRLMNAMYYGVPQSRQRMIFIGVREDIGIDPSHPAPMTKPIPVSAVLSDLGNTQDLSRDHVWVDESPAGRNTKTWHIANKAKQGEKYAGQQRRMRWDRPAPTVLKSGSEKVKIWPCLRNSNCHPLYTRTLSLLETRRVSSFPDDYILTGDMYERRARIGNAVPPLLMKAIAGHVYETILSRI